MRKRTRSLYHKQVKYVSKREQSIQKEKIANAFLDNGSRDFWSEISKIRRKSQKNTSIVEGLSNDNDITSCFSNHYEELYNSVTYDDEHWDGLYKNVCYDIESDCKTKQPHTITTEMVTEALSHLKAAKSDGFDGITTDYFLNGTSLLYKYISCLFNLYAHPLLYS